MAQATRSIRLADGRRLAYAQFGDPDGAPLFACHGFPGSRLEGALLHRAAVDTGFRLITPDRPGFGESDPRPGRTLLDWPSDLAALADHLGFARFHLLGISGGGPYALSCAAQLPGRLTAVGLIAPLGPLAEPPLLKIMHQPARTILAAASRVPPVADALFRYVLCPTYRRRPERLLRLQRRLSPGADARTLAGPEVEAAISRVMREAVRHGPEGLLEDIRVYVSRWGFELTGISLPVMLWHGLEDTVVPPQHSRRLALDLPGACAKFLPGEGHFSLPLHRGRLVLSRLKSM